MSIFPWMKKYEVNVESIDTQHKKLVELLNKLAEEMSQGKGSDVLNAIFNELADYTIYHFSDEEKYFDQINYPLSDEHKEKHRLFIEQLSGFRADFEIKKIGVSIEVMRFLKDWLIEHISKTDMGLGRMLNRSGIK